HLVDEQALPVHRHGREIVAIRIAKRMKMQVPARRHRDPARLQGKELAAADRDFRVLDGAAENAAGESDLSLGQPALAADGAGERLVWAPALYRQRSSPAARTSAGKLTWSPPTNVTVTSVVLPAVRVSARSKAMTCRPPGSSLMGSPGLTGSWNISCIVISPFHIAIWWISVRPAPATETARIIRLSAPVFSMSK